VDWLSFPRSVLTRRFQPELDSVIRAMGIATILLMDTAIIRMDTTGLIGTTAIPEAPHTATGIVTTATIDIIITTATKLA
jgi:hypothetical protein